MFSFQKLLSARPLPRGDVRHLQPGQPPTPEGRVFPMQIISRMGETCVPPFPGRGPMAVVAHEVGEVQTTPLGYALVSVSLASVSLSLR